MASANPSSSIIFFLIITLAYSIFKYYTKSPSTMKIWTIIYFSVLIIVQFFINLGLTTEICGFSQYSVALKQTIIPWLFIFGTINILLISFPNWLNPFSNTIGYFVVLMFGIKKLFINILKPTDKNNQALLDIYINPSLLINEITEENFDKFWISSKNIIKPEFYNNNTIKDKLLYMVKLKYIVSETIWYFLFGFLITAITNNYISSVKCNISVETLQKNDIKHHKEMLTKSNNNNNTKRVYTSNE